LFTRPDVIGYVEQITRNIEMTDATLSARDRFNLDRLQKEYTLPEARSDPKTRFDPPAIGASDAPLCVEGDLALSFVPMKP
jgi:hypothetical protein